MQQKYEVGKTYNIDKANVRINWADSDLFRMPMSQNPVRMPYYGITVFGQKSFDTVINQYALEANLGLYKFMPVIAGVACRGIQDCMGNKVKRQYDLWKDMVYGIYSPGNKFYPFIGGRGAKLHPKWLCFQYFMEDWDYLPGHAHMENELKLAFVIELREEYQNLPVDKQVYRYDTCRVVPFAGSNHQDICNYLRLQKEREEREIRKANQPVFLNKQPVQQPQYNAPVQTTTVYDPHVAPTIADYDNMLKDLSFMNQYPEPDLNGYMMHAVTHGPITPHISNPPRKSGEKVMCRVIPKKYRN